MSDAEQSADVEMLPCLRLHGFVSRHHQKHGLDAADARQHIFDKALMAGNINEADRFAARQRRMRETQIDGNAAALFFGQPVCVDAGKRPNQGCFPMIDVPGRSDHNLRGAAHITI